jgi:hypothetical protein
MTYALRDTRSLAVDALAAPIARAIALMALAALGLSGDPFHEPFHPQRRIPGLVSGIDRFLDGNAK